MFLTHFNLWQLMCQMLKLNKGEATVLTLIKGEATVLTLNKGEAQS